MRFLLMLCALIGCDVEDTGATPWFGCIARVCEHLVACQPVEAGQGWDWQTEAECRRTMRCGPDLDACEAAVEALACIGPKATPWVDEASGEGVTRIREACRAPVPQGLTGGGFVAGRAKPRR